MKEETFTSSRINLSEGEVDETLLNTLGIEGTGEVTTLAQSATVNYSDSVKDENENAYIGDCDIMQNETFTSSRTTIMSESRDEDNEVPLTTVEEHENQIEEMI